MSSKFVWEEGDVEILYAPIVVTKGGAGSGHYGHSGRPGEHGGSLPGKGSGLIVSDSFTAKHSNRAVIMNGKVYEGDENKGAYHTPIYARIVLANTGDFDRVVVGMAKDINRENAPEDSVFESRVMEKTDAYSIEVVGPMSRIVIAQDKYPKRSTVSQGINNLLRKVQRDVKRSVIDLPYFSEINLNFSTAWVSFPFSEIDDVAQIIWNDQYQATIQYKHIRVVKGGPGSGFEGHAGRPGEVGGSSSHRVGVMDMDPASGIKSRIPEAKQAWYRSWAKEFGFKGQVDFQGSVPGDTLMGFYDSETGHVVITDAAEKSGAGVAALAHETSHAKFEEVMTALVNDDKRVSEFASMWNKSEDRLVSEGRNLGAGMEYAKSFWNEMTVGLDDTDLAVNETFAEFSRKGKSETGRANVMNLVGADSALWQLYQLFGKAYDNLH